MRHALVMTQAPHATYQGATTSGPQYWSRPSQRDPHGPRIATAIAGMSPGDYRAILADVSGGLIAQQDPQTGANYMIVDWTPHNAWDAGTQQIIHAGHRKRYKVIAYSDITGEWREEEMPQPVAQFVEFNHWYGRTATDGTGRVFLAGWTYWPETGEMQVWATRPSSGSNGNTASHEWFPEAGGGSGRMLYHGGDWQYLQMYNPDTNSWWSGGVATGHTLHALLRYHPAHGKCLLVGGSSTLRRATLINPDGTFARVADAPADAHMESTSNGALLAHPAGCWLLISNTPSPRQCWAYWPQTNTWTAAGTMPDSTNVNATYAYDAERDVVYVLGEAGLYAWKMPMLTPPAADLAAVGVAVSSGSAALAGDVPLSAIGLSYAGGAATPVANVRISAAGLAEAAGQARLSASLLLIAAGAATANGQADVAAVLRAAAMGGASAGGDATLSGGAAGGLSAAGGASATGSGVLQITVRVAAAGGASAGGSAALDGNVPGALAAAGGAAADGSAVATATVALSAAGFVQAMGVGYLVVQVPLQAAGGARADGAATLSDAHAVVLVSSPRWSVDATGRRWSVDAAGRRWEV